MLDPDSGCVERCSNLDILTFLKKKESLLKKSKMKDEIYTEKDYPGRFGDDDEYKKKETKNEMKEIKNEKKYKQKKQVEEEEEDSRAEEEECERETEENHVNYANSFKIETIYPQINQFYSAPNLWNRRFKNY